MSHEDQPSLSGSTTRTTVHPGFPVSARCWPAAIAIASAAGLLLAPASAGAAELDAPPSSAVAVPAAPASPSAATTAASLVLPGAPAGTSETRRVDRVPTPKPAWFDCGAFAAGAQCATVKLPLDYDKPKGATTGVAVLRIKATDTKRKKLGTLFLNPGGPGGSGVGIAAAAPGFLSPAVRARFDIVGFDPRGTNFSDPAKCWKNLGAQGNALAGFNVVFPYTTKEKSAYIGSSEAFGKACSTTGRPLSGSMSTAQVARDMDVLRRAMGDKQLSYLGFSYGSYLGNVYANMFPSRVRSVAIDGVLEPQAWAGTRWTAGVPQTQRIKSGEGAAKALREILARCKKAGKKYCMLASEGDPLATYNRITASLKKKPLVLRDPDTGEAMASLSHATLTGILLSDMYAPDAGMYVDSDLSFVASLLKAPAMKGTALSKRQHAARTSLAAKVKAAATSEKNAAEQQRRQGAAVGWAFPYDNSPEAFQSVLCTDGLNPSRARNWSSYAAFTDVLAPAFGPLWTWASAPCASSTWTVRDEDAYRGGFNHPTANPVLVVGSHWDPATNYQGAVKAASLLPKSRLLSSNNWGHTAYGTSQCATKAVDDYLLAGKLPARGTVCTGDVQPFTVPLEGQSGPGMRRLTPTPVLPPVVPPVPGAVPRS